MNVRRLTACAMLSALTFVLSMLSVNAVNLQITVESFPILVGAYLFGPVYGMLIGGIGEFLNQLVNYGLTATTVIWILPHIAEGLIAGLFFRKRKNISTLYAGIAFFTSGILLTAMNSAVIYLCSKLEFWYYPGIVITTLFMRVVISIIKAVIFTFTVPAVCKALKPVVLTDE